jgi:rhodanese-related sulfurtransferase
MPAPNTISIEKLIRLIGTPKCPALIDVRPEDAFDADPYLIPSSRHRPFERVSSEVPGSQSTVVICQEGTSLSQGVAAWLRTRGVPAEVLDGGFQAWKQAELPLVPLSKLPPLDAQGRTVWVTRARPKIDRIACPWLIRRFVDPRALFLFVPPSDTMVEEFGLGTPPLLHLATMVRGADTARPELSPEAPGLLAASLGLSRMHADDLEQLEAGMLLYDALYRWCRDATDETHNWPTNKPKA